MSKCSKLNEESPGKMLKIEHEMPWQIPKDVIILSSSLFNHSYTILAFLNIFVIEIKVAFLNKGSLCPLCSNEAKPNAHLFFSCRKSLQVWAHIRDLVPFRRRFTSLQRITDSLIRGRSTSGVQGKLRCLAITITVYCIWLSRNKLIFEDYQFCFSKIKVLMYRQAHMLYLF
ncbi:hypothetical protein GmHk_10G029340 [Glycine max]|nr:hypothetical protein GmHk_10G029340 [Glycine max]